MMHLTVSMISDTPDITSSRSKWLEEGEGSGFLDFTVGELLNRLQRFFAWQSRRRAITDNVSRSSSRFYNITMCPCYSKIQRFLNALYKCSNTYIHTHTHTHLYIHLIKNTVD